MRKFIALICIFISFSFFSIVVNAQDIVDPSKNDRPDLSGWTLVSGSNISVNVSDSVMYYLGFDLTFQNPNKSTEFVRQIRIIIPFVVIKGTGSLDKNYSDAAVAYVTDGTEKAVLKDYLTKSDAILYIRWNIEPDLNRGTEKLVGENEVWFWNTTGEWLYGHNLKINKLISSETFSGFGKYPIMVGLKYSINKQFYNSIEIPHEFIIIAIRSTMVGK